MSDITITLPDGKTVKTPKGSTALDVARSLSEGLARNTVAAQIDGNIQDAFLPLEHDATLQLITIRDDKGVEIIRHSAAHVFAQALLRLYPQAKISIGPPIEDGFYYDADIEGGLKDEDLPRIEDEMRKVIKENHSVSRKEISKDEAKQLFKDNSYKLELIEEMDGTISIYSQGEFVDLCRGPHVPRTGMIEAFKLTKIAMAYWRGDAKNKQLTRVYGLVFANKKELKQHIFMLEEAKKRDHRKLGQRLNLFYFDEKSPGSPFFTGKGSIIYNALRDFLRAEYVKRGYDEVITPNMYHKSLWEISGHWDHFQSNMFVFKVDNEDYSLKPMNCPGHCLMFKKHSYSYRQLPVRFADFGALHRNELSGTLGGLTRVRKLCQDDGHIFCTEGQVEKEMSDLLQFVKFIYEDIFGFDYSVELSTRPDKAMGAPELWTMAEASLEKALNANKIPFNVNPGDGAFYGPKIDIHIKDVLGRNWQCATIQLDFQMPKRFELTYEGEDGKKHQVVMIHRAIFGSLERFIGIITEHYAGKFPLWLSPEQVRIIPVSDNFNDYAREVKQSFMEAGIRAHVDDRRESVSKKVRESQIDYVNYTVVVGDNEQNSKTVTVRNRENEIVGTFGLTEFAKTMLSEIVEKV